MPLVPQQKWVELLLKKLPKQKTFWSINRGLGSSKRKIYRKLMEKLSFLSRNYALGKKQMNNVIQNDIKIVGRLN